jgi:hypothetical protein
MLTPETKAALKAAHPNTKLHVVKVGNDVFVLRKPSHVEWDRYESENGEDKSGETAKALVKNCVVYPDEAVFERIMSERYAIHQPLGDVIGRLVGLEKAQELEVF